MPKTLLLADDSVTIQKVVGISFASEDIQLVAVDNGTAAVAKAREVRPDIVLADVVMPGLNGYEVCRQIKADPSLRHVPVLLLTGTFEAFDEARAREVGSDGHITKPFEAQALVDLVNARLAASAPPAPAVAEAKSAVGASPLFGEEEEPFDFMSEENTEPSGVRAAALADDALSFGGADDLEVNASDDLEDADSGIAPLADDDDDENAETLPPVDTSDPFDDAPAQTRVLFGEANAAVAAQPDASNATQVLFGAPEAAGVGTITPGDAGVAGDPFAELIGGARDDGHAVSPTDLGDPFSDDDGQELPGAPAARTTVVLSEPDAPAWPVAEVAEDDGDDLFGQTEPVAVAAPLSMLEPAPMAQPRAVDPADAMPNRDELRNMLEKLAWEAFGDVTDRIVRETVQKVEQIAWEVIPKMAETLIREEIRKLKESDEP
jgi:CheY-like chemotaxis protein